MSFTYSKFGAICPHCQTLHAANDDNYELYDEGTSDWQCHSCEKHFRVSVHKSFSWDTEATP